MKLPNFDYANRRWDAYKQFHCVPYWPFIQLETGELMCVATSFRPDARRRYKELNISVVMTTDDTCQELYRDRECTQKLAKSWLTQGGGQLLLIDHDTHEVVKLYDGLPHPETRFPQSMWKSRIPAHLRQWACAYFAGPGEPPQGTGVMIAPPLAMTKKQKDHVNEIRAACHAWQATTELVVEKRWFATLGHVHRSGYWLAYKGVGERIPETENPGPVRVPDLFDKTFATLSEGMRARILACGVVTPSDPVVVERVYVEPIIT